MYRCHGSILVALKLFFQIPEKQKTFENEAQSAEEVSIAVRSAEKVDTARACSTLW